MPYKLILILLSDHLVQALRFNIDRPQARLTLIRVKCVHVQILLLVTTKSTKVSARCQTELGLQSVTTQCNWDPNCVFMTQH